MSCPTTMVSSESALVRSQRATGPNCTSRGLTTGELIVIGPRQRDRYCAGRIACRCHQLGHYRRQLRLRRAPFMGIITFVLSSIATEILSLWQSSALGPHLPGLLGHPL